MLKGESMLYAHTPAPGSEQWHTLEEHTRHVAELARGFAEPFDSAELAYWVGLLHDTGKSNPDFQAYLQRCYANPISKGRGPDHKAAGATLALRQLAPLALLIQGHHGGLKSKTEFEAWLNDRQKDQVEGTTEASIEASIARMRSIIPEIDTIQALHVPAFVKSAECAELFLRMLFSTLVDADYLDTEQHGSPYKSAHRGTTISLATLLKRFDAAQQQLSGAHEDLVSQARHTFYQACIAASSQPPGLFRLAIPTGGGKTRSGMAFALHHAIRHEQRRIVVAVPFISITEQTADVYRDLFQASDGDDNLMVLEHHSGADGRAEEGADDAVNDRWRRLASENWDAPIVVTTTVQLFESLLASSTSRCRKLHRLARSVIILDEAQALPPHLLTPILSVLRELCTNYGTTVVLSTATQPAFEHVRAFAGLSAYDILPDAARWFTELSRVRYEWNTATPLAWEEVAETLRTERQAMAVVNTKRDVLALLDAVDDPDALHLSTLLCGAHRRVVIGEVRRRLKAAQPCRLISTQVVEAGVDLDFPLVLRALGPLDRIIQAAGRCNREGKLAYGRVVVFDPAEGALPPGAYRTATDLTRSMIQSGNLNPDDPQTMTTYFRRLFATITLDRENIEALRKAWNFTEVAKKFRMIDEDTEDVIVAYGSKAAQQQVQIAIQEIRNKSMRARFALRQIQPYLVSIRTAAAKRYRTQGFLEPIDPEGKLAIGIWRGKYDPIRGLIADDDRSQLTNW